MKTAQMLAFNICAVFVVFIFDFESGSSGILRDSIFKKNDSPEGLRNTGRG